MNPRLNRLFRFTLVLAGVIFFIVHRMVSKKEYQRILELKAQLKGNEYDLSNDFGSNKEISHEKVIYEAVSAPKNYERANACFFALARNEDLYNMAETVRSVEDRFNHRFHYDWVFVNNEEFSDEFKRQLANLVSGNIYFEKIPTKYWDYPEWLDKELALKNRLKSRPDVLYGGMKSYRFMCRFYSGFFYKLDIMQKYDFAWRVEPETVLYCDVNYDVFKFMIDNDKHYGFTISIRELENTIPTLWEKVTKFIELNPNYVQSNNLFNLISDDAGKTYNLCHFWTNFQIIDLRFLRSEVYENYFNFLDLSNGFFYERWGDAPIISIAVALFLRKDNVHYFEDIGYFHKPMTNCPIDDDIWKVGNCMCDQRTDTSFRSYSCTGMFYEAIGKKKPDGWQDHVGV